MRKDFLIFGSPAIEESDIGEVVATLRSGWIGTGPRVARFEQLFRRLEAGARATELVVGRVQSHGGTPMT